MEMDTVTDRMTERTGIKRNSGTEKVEAEANPDSEEGPDLNQTREATEEMEMTEEMETKGKTDTLDPQRISKTPTHVKISGWIRRKPYLKKRWKIEHW